MNEFNAANRDVAKAKKIRRQYLSREENKMEQLKRMDDKVKAPGKIIASIMCVIGLLTMGSGMSQVMVWGNMTTGLKLGIPGLLIATLAYPVYFIITGRRKKKYATEIMKLSDNLMNNE